jgi:hypothetical protein
MTSKTDLILVLAVLGVAVFILWKAGIFKVASSVTETAKKVVDSANKLIEPITSLPDNIAYLTDPTTVSDFKKAVEVKILWKSPTDVYGIATPTDKAIKINQELDRLYPNMTDAQQLQLWAKDSVYYGYSFNDSGYAVDRNGEPVIGIGNQDIYVTASGGIYHGAR